MFHVFLTTLAACAAAENTEDGLSLLQVNAHRHQQEPCDLCASVPDTVFSEEAHKKCAKALVRVGKGSEKRQAKTCAKMGPKVAKKCCVSTATTAAPTTAAPTTTTTTTPAQIYELAPYQYIDDECETTVSSLAECQAAAAQLGKKFATGAYTQTAGCYGYPSGTHAGTLWFSTYTNAKEKDLFSCGTADQRRVCTTQEADGATTATTTAAPLKMKGCAANYNQVLGYVRDDLGGPMKQIQDTENMGSGKATLDTNACAVLCNKNEACKSYEFWPGTQASHLSRCEMNSNTEPTHGQGVVRNDFSMCVKA